VGLDKWALTGGDVAEQQQLLLVFEAGGGRGDRRRVRTLAPKVEHDPVAVVDEGLSFDS
jgi:hypothetical protein